MLFRSIAIWQKINSVYYGYYAKRFHFTYEDLQPGATIVASGPCPSVIWIANPPISSFDKNADAEQILSEIHISKIGVAELKRYDSRIVIVVHE